MTLKELLEQRGKLAARMQELAGRQDKWTEEDRANWKAINDDYNALMEKITVAQRAEEVARQIAATQPEPTPAAPPAAPAQRQEITAETRALAFQGWSRIGTRLGVTEAQRDAMHLCGVEAGGEVVFRLNANAERRTAYPMNLTDANGGYTNPDGFVANFEQALLAFGGPRQVADIIRTATGNDLKWPSANDTGNKGALLAEETTMGDAVKPTVGSKTFNAYKMSSTPILISFELLQDSAFNLANYAGQWCGERIGRIEADYYTTGSGSAQPQGYVTGATSGLTSASATAVTVDELLALQHSVDPAYRNGPGVSWAMNDTTLLALRKLKDGNGVYLWQPGIQANVPDMLLGNRLLINQSMANMASGTKAIAFGDFSKFKIRDVAEVRMIRLNELYAATDQVGFIAFHRTDSGVLDAGTHPIKVITQHA
jgi:HK97 family phage major capsid protein